MPNLFTYLTRFRRRLRLRDGWRWLQRTLWMPALAALLVQLAGRLLPVERLDLWSLAAFAVWLPAVLAAAAFYPAPAMRVARRVDVEIGLRERLSTALAFAPTTPSGSGEGAGRVFADPALLARQQADALAAAATVQPQRDFPLRWQPRPLLAALALAALALASALLPNPQDIVLAERRAVREEAARQAERVEQLQREIEQAQALTPEEREELLRRLAELAEQLRANRGDLEQAVADLSNVEKELQARLDPAAAAQAANLEALAERLAALANTPRDPQAGAAQAAAEALAALAEQMERMDAEQQQALAQQMAQAAAQAAQSGDQQLAQALASLAQALQSDDSTATSSAAQAVQAALAQSEARLNDQQALEAAIAQLQQGRQQLSQTAQAAVAAAQAAQAGQSGAQAGIPGAGNQPGQGSQPGQSGQQGQNPGQGQGVGPGGGSQANTLPPAQGGRPNVRPHGDAAITDPGELAGQVYSPWQRPAPSGDQVFIPGQDTGQGETTTSQGQSNLPGASNPALVPYSQVYYSYFTAASQAIQSGHIPTGLSAYVKNYFTQLAPR